MHRLRVGKYFFALMACSLIMWTMTVLGQNVTPKVNANQYQQFWIWGNIRSAPYLKEAEQLYILQGDVHCDKYKRRNQVLAQGVGVLKTKQQRIWLVYRNHTLTWRNDELKQILNRVQQWENQGNHIVGIQIDFDSKTKNLHDYALFLQQLRTQLPSKYQLSITGLLDWTNMQDADTLALFRQNIDEIIIQTYQGTKTIANAQAYIHRIALMGLPYKIGLVQHGAWPAPNKPNDPYFKGYVVFLLRTPNP